MLAGILQVNLPLQCIEPGRAKILNYESGGQEFESLRVRHLSYKALCASIATCHSLPAFLCGSMRNVNG